MAGASPRESSSIIRICGRLMKAMASVSICCWPPERLPATSSIRSASSGKDSIERAVAAAAAAWSPRSSHAAMRRFSRTVSDGKTP